MDKIGLKTKSDLARGRNNRLLAGSLRSDKGGGGDELDAAGTFEWS